MIAGIGNDILEISRIKKACDNQRFITRNFTPAEIEMLNQRSNMVQSIALNFAIKEAVVKAMGCGFRGLDFVDIEILRDGLGKPYLSVNNKLKTVLERLNIDSIHVSGAHCKAYATGFAVAQMSLSKRC